MKIIMAIFVIAIHTHPLETIQGTLYYKIYTILVGIAVPFFFISSGYLVFKKMKGKYDDKDNIDILKKYIVKTIKLYIMWNIIYLPLAIYGYIKNGNSILESVLLYLRGLFVIGEHYYSWMLWYLLATIYGNIVILILLKHKCKEWQILVCSLIVFIISNIITHIVKETDNVNALFNMLKNLIKYTIVNGRIFQGFTYISIGMYLSKKQINIDRKKLIKLVVVSFVLEVFFNNAIFNLLLYIFIFYAVISINLEDRKIYYYFRKMSTILYFIHMWIFFIYSIVVGMENCYGANAFFVTIVVSLFFSIIIMGIQERRKSKLIKLLFNY